MKMIEAIAALNVQLSEGEEFPDAVHRIANKYRVSEAELTDAWDDEYRKPRKPTYGSALWCETYSDDLGESPDY